MMIKFTNTIWLNIEPEDIARIDIDAKGLEDLRENACYYVTITFRDGTKEESDYFKTFEEARVCAENFIHALDFGGMNHGGEKISR